MKIQFALIAPRGLHRFTKMGDMHFIVPGYSAMNWYADQDMFKMLDNGAWEYGEAVEDDKLVHWAIKTKASEIVLPDKLFDHPTTLRRTAAFLQHFPREKSAFRYAMVVQGRDPVDWVKNYLTMKNLFSDVDTICVPKWLEMKYPGERLAVLEHLRCAGSLDSRPHHLFGMETLTEIQNVVKSKIPNIRSIDTAKPITYGYNVERLPSNKKLKVVRPPRDVRIKDTIREVMVIQNIIKLKQACRGEDVTE